jgi:predicted secreted acid phosphatase
LNQADKIRAAKEKNAELEKQLAEAQGLFPSKLVISPNSDY